jgi:ubiquinone/menaquinone biosynthesis C-methylase UbiE
MTAPSSGVARYGDTWKREEDLDSLNARIHDGAPLDLLRERAHGYRELLFERTYPQARPKEGDWTLEFGSGVGWIMQAMLEAYPISRAVGLDISENMIARAQERLRDPRASWVHYDGLHIPFEDGEVPIIYSTAAIQHVEKHVAFILMKELYRILKPGGHAVLHFLSVDNIVPSGIPYEAEKLGL